MPPDEEIRRYRRTLVVETPEGAKTGSTVMEHTVRRGWFKSSGSYYEGEAIVIDLGKRGVLFALMDESNPGTGEITSLMYAEHAGEKRVVFPYFPLIVCYKSIQAPLVMEIAYKTKSQRIKRPGRSDSWKTIGVDRMSECFGNGVVLKEFSVEWTNDPVTKGVIHKYLPSSFRDQGQLLLRDYETGKEQPIYPSAFSIDQNH